MNDRQKKAKPERETERDCKPFEIVSVNRRQTNGRLITLRFGNDQNRHAMERLIFERLIDSSREMFIYYQVINAVPSSPEFQKTVGQLIV
jgi:hypothetical protein